MDYRKIYDTFIADRIAHPTGDIRAQIHHIVPIEHGGTNEISNLVRLSVRDHLFAHKVLGRFGMCATATKQMTRDVAAKMMAGMPGTIASHGRGKVSPKKCFNSYLNANLSKIHELGDALGEQLVSMCKDCAPGYIPYFTHGKKSRALFLSFMTKFRDFILFRKDDGEPAEEDETGAAGPRIVFTRAGKRVLEIGLQKEVSCLDDICRKENTTYILRLYYGHVGPAQKKFFDGICDGSIVDPRMKFYTSDRMTPHQFANESKSFGILALKYAIAKVTGCKAGTYAIDDIVKESVEGLRMLLVQNIVLSHLDDGGWKMLDLCPEEDDVDGTKLGIDVMLLSRHFETPDVSDFMYAIPAMSILRNVISCVAFAPKRQDDLFEKALPILMGMKDKMKPTYDYVISKCGLAKVRKYAYARAFLIKNAIRAVQKVAAAGNEETPRAGKAN